MNRNQRVGLHIVVLTVFAALRSEAQTSAETPVVNVCDVVASPADYNRKLLSVTVILSPSDHSLSLYGTECVPKEDYNVTTQAILPAVWDSLPNGKKLRTILKHRHKARVELVGTFESDRGPYGPDVARFRFSISQQAASTTLMTHLSLGDTYRCAASGSILIHSHFVQTV
jgi:hypothetical protein